MKIKSRGVAKVELMMTPMIDIVFQLLIFFIMSFQIAVAEGDFLVRMPEAGVRTGPLNDEITPTLKLRLEATDDGQLAGIFLNETRLANFGEVREFVMRMVVRDRGPVRDADSIQIEIESDYGLRYAHVMAAVTAVSGYMGPDGTRIDLIHNVKLATPRPSDPR